MLKKSKTIVLMVVPIIMIVIFISGCTSTNNSTSSGYKVFENQIVKFSYPANLTLVDKSRDRHLFIQIYNGSTSDPDVGQVVYTTYRNGIKEVLFDWDNTTISGYPAQQGKNQYEASDFLYMNDKECLAIIFDPNYDSTANIIIDSLVIKQTPTL